MVYHGIMSACLPFDAVVTASAVQLDTLVMVGNQIDVKNTPSCFVLSSLVEGLQEVLRQTYRAAAGTARDAGNPSEAAIIWEKMGTFADGILKKLSSLKEVYYDCGTPALYDLALDYKSACQSRHAGSQEEAACQNENRMPAGLFPAMT